MKKFGLKLIGLVGLAPLGALKVAEKRVNELETSLVAVSVAVGADTPESALNYRLKPGGFGWCDSVREVHRSVDKLMATRELVNKQMTECTVLSGQVRNLRLQLAQALPQKHGSSIYEYPGDIFVAFDPTTDGAYILGAWRTIKEAEAAVADVVRREGGPGSTKRCGICNSRMIELRGEDKKMCSNGACENEIHWPLEEGQVHMHKRPEPAEKKAAPAPEAVVTPQAPASDSI